MMPSPGLERTARLIAENVVAAVMREPDGAALHSLMCDALMVALLRELLPAMAAGSGEMLAAACNRCLDHLTDLRLPMPRVETVDLIDGSVTLRRASRCGRDGRRLWSRGPPSETNAPSSPSDRGDEPSRHSPG